MVPLLGGEFNANETLPNFSAWHKDLMDRPLVKKVFADREAAIQAEKAQASK